MSTSPACRAATTSAAAALAAADVTRRLGTGSIAEETKAPSAGVFVVCRAGAGWRLASDVRKRRVAARDATFKRSQSAPI
jgi:hypothetical protein